MANSQQATVGISDNVAKLHKLILRQESKDRIGPLITIILCQDVDNQAKLLRYLNDEVQQIKGSQSERASHISEHIHKTEQDLMNLRQLIAENAQSDKDIKVNVHQLRDLMTEVMEQEHIDWTALIQDLKVIIEAMGREQQAFNGVADAFEVMGQQVTSLQHEINEIKNAIKKGPPDLLTSELIKKLDEKITSTLDCVPKETEAFKISLEAVRTERGLDEDPAHGKSADDDIGQSTTNNRTPEHSQSSREEPQQRGPNIEDWPIILQFINIYEQFKDIYKSKKPENETQFIETFLNRIADEIDVHHAEIRSGMEDAHMVTGHEPLVMGMTPEEYQAAFAAIEYENFYREVEESENLQRRQLESDNSMTALLWYKRPEVWALVLGGFTLLHSLFVQWLWPLIEMSGNSPYTSPHKSSEE
ncbi:hypothetical protein GQX73_g5456 [Xylaria multiplex]|uniref:Uncharacterized protein n=1 Tax=Xylaria multiplex TaxID=323545 RepID=A0A7C8ISR8_9PEZI|nr:hypothetical protein GQX73_g5456 [Xylaria multiplex]